MTIDRVDATATDDVLVAATRRGDDRAFEQLYGRYQRRIAAYVYGMVGDHGRAEDVTQEVFIAALRRIRATDRPIAFKPWVYEIAKNACIDAFRRARRGEEVSFEVADDAGAVEAARMTVPTPTPDAAVDAKQQLDNLCGAFGGLSETHHQILVMRELEGLSYREIGDRLGMSRPSVESTLFRARRRLSEEYGELVSGARCLAVQALLAGGVEEIGVRDHRRLSRHIAHCQPCRREAYAAGLDTVGITARLRRVAALLPLPLLARPQVAQYADSAGAGWGKAAAAAAAVLVAGGAGVAGHTEGHAPIAPAQAAVRAADDGGSNPGAIAAAAAAATSGVPTPVARLARAARAERIAGRNVVVRIPARSVTRSSGARQRSTAPVAAAPAPSVTEAVPPAAVAPSATGTDGGGGAAAKDAVGRSPKAPAVHQAADPVAPVAQAVDQTLQTVQDAATKADGRLGQTVGLARDLLAQAG